MTRALRENALCALWACLGCAVLAWLGLVSPVWSDYEVESAPAVRELLAGHIGGFLSVAPVYGGSLIERAPFAELASLAGGGETSVYRLLALPCLLATALIGVWLLARMRAQRGSLLARAVVLGLCAANPIALLALELGHPEELLGASLCVAAALLAAAPVVGRPRALLTGALIGLAVANKQWALLVAGPVLLALPAGRRAACLLAAGAVAASIEAPLLLGGSGSFASGALSAASSSSTVFQPEQLWWFFGDHGALVHGLFGAAKPGYRAAPAWANQISHPLALLAALAIAAALWLRLRERRLPLRAVLLAMTSTMLVRCLLDTWDTAYYLLPAILALLAYEAHEPSGRPAVLALTLTVLSWMQFQWLPGHVSPDAQSAIFLLWMLPLLAALAARLLGLLSQLQAPSGGDSLSLRPRLGQRRQETTVSSFGRAVSTSHPPSRTTVRSSMRTPSTPGR
jgi:hypothetical protein